MELDFHMYRSCHFSSVIFVLVNGSDKILTEFISYLLMGAGEFDWLDGHLVGLECL